MNEFKLDLENPKPPQKQVDHAIFLPNCILISIIEIRKKIDVKSTSNKIFHPNYSNLILKKKNKNSFVKRLS